MTAADIDHLIEEGYNDGYEAGLHGLFPIRRSNSILYTLSYRKGYRAGSERRRMLLILELFFNL